jgi:hypothetical protein
MAPTITMTKLVATAIATFASTDKFIIFPSIMAATPMTSRFCFSVLYVVSNFNPLMDAEGKLSKKDEVRSQEQRGKRKGTSRLELCQRCDQ